MATSTATPKSTSGTGKKPGRPPKPRPESAQLVSDHPQIKRVPLTTDFVARSSNSTFWGNYKNYLLRLSRSTDQLTTELGIDYLDRMMNDPQISSAIYTLVLQAVARGMKAKPRYPKGHDLYQAGVQMYDFISYNLDYCNDDMVNYLETGLTETLEEIAVSKLVYGNSLSEWTCRVQSGGPLDGKLVLSSIKVKPPDVYGFVVDEYGNVPGMAVYTGGAADSNLETPGVFGSMSSAVAQIEMPATNLGFGWEVLPVGKFLITAHRRRKGDPRGTSSLRPAYNAWYLLMQLWPEYQKFLTQFASPSLVATLPPKTPGQVRNPDTGELEDPADVLYNELLDFANGSIVVARAETEIDALFSQGEGTAFIQAINLLNHQMVKAILHSLLATETANHQTRAASSTHKDIMDLPTRGIKNSLNSMMHRQCFKRLIYFNYGPLAAQLLTPWASLGDIAPEDKIDAIQAYSTIDFKLMPSQYVGVCNELEIDPPNDDELGILQQAAETEAAPQPAPVAAPADKPAGKPASKPAAKPAAQKPAKQPAKQPAKKAA